MIKKALLLLSCCASTISVYAQTTYLNMGSDAYHTMDRVETLSGRLSDSLRLNDKLESRKNAVYFAEGALEKAADTTAKSYLSRLDKHNLQQLISESGEWAPNEEGAIRSRRRPFLNTFYKTQYNAAYVKTKDFFLVVNPLINVMSTSQQNSPSIKSTASMLTYNSRDLEIRGWISKKIGFYTVIAETQEILPAYVYNYAVKGPRYQAGKWMAMPGADYFIKPDTARSKAFEYLMASGYIDFAAVKDRVNITFGSGKFFFGDGISSLFLTDFSSNMPFLRLRTRIWKINYETLYLQLTDQFNKLDGDGIYGKKYATIHNISYNASRWLNLGFFESAVFNRSNGYELSYLNPIALTYTLNYFNGAGDKSLIGFFGKALVGRHIQLYGQVALNEFRAKEFFSNRGWYGNKWGLQMGAKYFDAFTIKNLDLQAELNIVRPYMYTAKDSSSNYTNYNQPLADPLGAGFYKAIGVAKYQASKNWMFTLKCMYYVQGTDTGTMNNGNVIYKGYTTASNEYGVKLINGPRSECLNVNLNASYQMARNVYLDMGAVYRNFTTTATTPAIATSGYINGPLTTNLFYFGIRVNAPRRDYSFF